MRKIILIIALFAVVIIAAQTPHRYYIGKTEVDSSFWNCIPDSIRQRSSSEKWDYDSLITETLNLPLEYYLDYSDGKYVISRKSDEVIALLYEQLAIIRQSDSQNALRLQVGDTVPNFNVVKNPGGALVEDVLYKGKCYLINFWATWCGNCLLELLPDEMPKLAENFIENKDFVFLPICIDSSLEDLHSFFSSVNGERWRHLEYVTTLDNERSANGIFAEPGNMPLTIVVGVDGRIKYIKNGRLSTEEDFDELERAIVWGLSKLTE